MFDEKLKELGNAIVQKDKRVRELEASLEDKSQHIQRLKREVADIENAIAQKDERVRELEVNLEDRNQHIQHLEGEVTEIRNAIAQREERIRDFEIENLRIHSEINSIKSSVTWRTVTKWHSFIEQLMPQETRRRRWYDLSLIGLRTIANEGGNSFWWKYKQHRASKRLVQSSLKSTKIELPNLDILSEDFAKEEDIINKKVSIVIPTKNAGHGFDFTLEKIRTQKGINDIELIIVDSGSIDETVKLAEKYGANVYSIKPEEFNHGLTRNYGAEKATGDYLLFMVQDAIPIGDYWLYSMVKVLENNTKIAAATCRQVPRSDADLFASYAMWGHYKFLGFNKDKIVSANKENFKKLSAIEKRRISGIDNVCSCMKKDIFDKFKFKQVDFAEDIDLGIRLIESGYKLGFLHSVGVIHSHNRNSDYFLRRYYGSNKSLAKMFNSPPLIKEQDVDLVLNAILSLYNSLKWSLHTLSSKYEKNIELDSFFFVLKDSMSKEWQRHTSNEKGEKTLDELLSKFEVLCDNTKPINNNFLCEDYLNILDGFHAYLKSISQNYELTELIGPVYKLFAIWCGSYLGDLFYYKFNNKKIQYLDDLFTRGV